MGIALLDAVRYLGFSRHAAAQEDFLFRVAALGVGQGAEVAEDPLLGVLPDGAGVHNHHVRPFGLAADCVAALDKIAPELFGVGFVLLTAVGLHIGHGGDAPVFPIGGDFITAGELRIQRFLGNDGGFGIHRLLLCG